MKKLCVALGLAIGSIHASYAEPTATPQVPGYYHGRVKLEVRHKPPN